MKVLRKKAITALQKGRGLSLKSAKKLEKQVYECSKNSHARIIRFLITDKTLNLQKVLKLMGRDVKIEKINENEDDKFVEEGEVTCGKCGCKKITKTELQTRSGDEGATTFYKCTKCKSRWKK